MGRDVMTIGRRTGGLTASFTAEGAAGTESTSSYNNVTLQAKKLRAFTRISMELDMDAIVNIGDLVVEELGLSFSTKEDAVGFGGTGTASDGSIEGILTKIEADSTLVSHVVETNTDLFTEVDATTLAQLMAVIPKYARAGSKWYCSQTAFDLVFQRIAAAAGGNTQSTLGPGFGAQYLGYMIVISEDFTSSTSAINGTTMLAFGNLAQATTMGERRGMSISRTDERYWDTDEIGIKAIERIDIAAHEIGTSSVGGPFAALVGNT